MPTRNQVFEVNQITVSELEERRAGAEGGTLWCCACKDLHAASAFEARMCVTQSKKRVCDLKKKTYVSADDTAPLTITPETVSKWALLCNFGVRGMPCTMRENRANARKLLLRTGVSPGTMTMEEYPKVCDIIVKKHGELTDHERRDYGFWEDHNGNSVILSKPLQTSSMEDDEQDDAVPAGSKRKRPSREGGSSSGTALSEERRVVLHGTAVQQDETADAPAATQADRYRHESRGSDQEKAVSIEPNQMCAP